MDSKPLRGRVTVVTGASDGIGAAVARALASEDVHVALAARRKDALLEVQAGLDRLIEEERAAAGRDPERDPEFWSRKIAEVEIERRGYHRLAAKGHMTDEELVAALSELDEIWETAERELETARARSEALDRLERDRDALMESYAGMVSETLEDLAPEERHRIYKLLRLGVRFHPDWPLEITGVFAQIGEETEMGSSYSKLSPLSV